METCRICLNTDPVRQVTDLQAEVNIEAENQEDIMLFCLGIESVPGFISKLCLTCYQQIISYFNFKCMALRNDAYLKSLDCNNSIIHTEIKSEPYDCKQDSIKHIIAVDVKDENSDIIKQEDYSHSSYDYESDDVVLSVIKHAKLSETDSCKDSSKTIRKRGRPKKVLQEGSINKSKICEECGKSVKDLKAHLRLHKSEPNKFKCKVCDKVLCSRSSRRRHFKAKHLGIKHHCEICGKDVVSLTAHQRLLHDNESLKHKCAECGRGFLHQSSLEIHMFTHLKENTFECDICHKMYRSQNTLNFHKRQIHYNEKSHLCQYCSKRFFKKSHLQIHLRKHTKEKPYPCGECGKALSSLEVLKRHRATHTGQRRYACPHCDRTFVLKSYLTKHILIHTKEKRYPCKYCGIKFGRSDHRKRHEKTAHENIFKDGN